MIKEDITFIIIGNEDDKSHYYHHIDRLPMLLNSLNLGVNVKMVFTDMKTLKLFEDSYNSLEEKHYEVYLACTNIENRLDVPLNKLLPEQVDYVIHLGSDNLSFDEKLVDEITHQLYPFHQRLNIRALAAFVDAALPLINPISGRDVAHPFQF